jgi:hypothetical protein
LLKGFFKLLVLKLDSNQSFDKLEKELFGLVRRFWPPLKASASFSKNQVELR